MHLPLDNITPHTTVGKEVSLVLLYSMHSWIAAMAIYRDQGLKITRLIVVYIFDVKMYLFVAVTDLANG